MDIDLSWNRAGRADADRYGIEYAEAIAVIASDTSVQVRVGDTVARLMFLGGRAGAVIVVTVDRVARNISAYEITEVRPATAREAELWEMRQP